MTAEPTLRVTRELPDGATEFVRTTQVVARSAEGGVWVTIEQDPENEMVLLVTAVRVDGGPVLVEPRDESYPLSQFMNVVGMTGLELRIGRASE